jgi:hypothetical protein
MISTAFNWSPSLGGHCDRKARAVMTQNSEFKANRASHISFAQLKMQSDKTPSEAREFVNFQFSMHYLSQCINLLRVCDNVYRNKFFLFTPQRGSYIIM